MRGRTTLAVVVLGVALVGCSSSGEEPDAAAPHGAQGSSAPAGGGSAPPATTSPADLPGVPALRQERGIVDQLQIDACPTRAGRRRVTGEVTNAGRHPRDLVVVVNWTNDAYDVLARGVAVVEDVAPGATRTWRLGADVEGDVTTCTPSARAGQLRAG